MDLRCQLRFEESPEGARAILEADSPDRAVHVTVEATGADQGEALAALSERTRELYGAAISMVDTVEELARTYFVSEGD